MRGDSCVGGLAGYSTGTIAKCHSVGTIVGDECTGGLLGINDIAGAEIRGVVSYCYSAGNVSGGWAWSGGLVGLSTSIATCSYSNCNVTGDACVGGLVGRVMSSGSFPRDTIVNCYSTGHVNGSSDVGGLLYGF